MPKNSLKRCGLRVAASLLFLFLAAAWTDAVWAQQDRRWGTYLHDPQRTNVTPQRIKLPPEESWTARLAPLFRFPKRRATEVISPPMIYDGAVYVGSTRGRFYSFDLSTGRPLWEFKLPSNVDGPATVVEKMVCFGTIEGVLYCLERATGKELWHFNSRSEVLSAPVITPDTVYFTSMDNRVYALDRYTGKKLWSYTHRSSHYVMPRLYTSPAVSHPDSGTRIYVQFADGYLVSLDTATGRELWVKDVLGGKLDIDHARRTPLVYGEMVYAIDSKGYIRAFDAKSGAERMRFDIIKAVDFAIRGRNIYIVGRKRLVALNRRTGRILWTSTNEHGTPYSILSSGRHLFVLSNLSYAPFGIEHLERTYGYITAYSITDGEEVWGRRLGSELWSNAAVSEGYIALVTTKGRLKVYGMDQAD